MDFPSWSSLISAHFALFIVPVGFVVGLIMFVAALRNKQSVFKPPTRPFWVLFGILASILSCCGGLGLVSQAVSDYSFRKLSPIDVTSLEIAPVERQNGLPDTARSITITDREAIAHGLKLLEQNRAHTLQHEHFSDGYFVTAKTPKRSFSFYVYKRSHRVGGDLDVTVVALVTDTSPGGRFASTAIDCPEFVKWLDEEVTAQK
jgi:hypothetical protein